MILILEQKVYFTNFQQADEETTLKEQTMCKQGWRCELEIKISLEMITFRGVHTCYGGFA
jgi:hypothetical protein